MIYAHIIDNNTGTLLVKTGMQHAPRVGDEIRLQEDKYVRVKVVVWCVDEEDPLRRDRVNIGVTGAV